MSTAPTYDGAPFEPNESNHRRRLARAVERINGGRINVTLDVTLRAGQTTTVVVDDNRLTPFSFIAWMPLTAAASTAEKAGIWASPSVNGAVTLNHASNAATDQNFRLLVIG